MSLKGVAVFIVFALLASVLLFGSISELKIEAGYSYEPDITTDRDSYIQTDMIGFTIHLLEVNAETYDIQESEQSFNLSITKDYPYALLGTLTGTSPLTFQYPATSLRIGANGFTFFFSGIPASRSITEYRSVEVTQTRETDTTPPVLVSYSNTMTNIFTQAQVRFSEPVQTLTSNNFFITGVAGTILQTGEFAVLTPIDLLDYETTYTVSLNGIKDIAGNAMTDFSWSFRTTGDGFAPEVTIVYPYSELRSGYDLRQADVYDVSYTDYRMANAGVAYNNVLTMTGMASDVSGIASVTAYNEANGQTTTGTGGSSWTVSVTLVPDNNNNIITITAKDPNGNAGIDKILVHYSTGGVQVISVHFTEPTSIGADGNGQFVTDGQTVNVTGQASYTYRNLIAVYWHNNLTDERGTAWSGGSHSVDWAFTAELVNGENPIWVEVKEESGFSTYRAFIAICNYMTLTIDADPDAVQLFNQVSFTSTIDGGAPAFVYQWDFGDGASSTEADPTHSYATEGSFTVSLVVTDSHSTARNDEVSVTVGTTPPPAGISAISMVGAAAIILLLAGLFLRFVFDIRMVGYLVLAIGFVLLVIYCFIALQQPPI